MIKVFYFIKRKPGTTHEQFRDHFENVHVKMSERNFGHLMLRYQRNYPTVVVGGPRHDRQPIEYEFDCISVWWLENQAALDQIRAILADPVIGREHREDEERFLDQDITMMITCADGDVVDSL
jgi:hypothetical protein